MDPSTGMRFDGGRSALAYALPKAELHIHVEGTLEPEMMLELAARNGVRLPYDDVAGVRRAYEFSDLQSFLDLYYQGAAVLQTEADFADLVAAYIDRAHADNVRHVELFFDPQTHTDRGVPFSVVVDGLVAGIETATSRSGMTVDLIMCFLRHLDEPAAMTTLEEALTTGAPIIGVGLDSSELGNPPAKFANVFAAAREAGLRLVAHAGEEGPPQYIWESLDVLGVARIDHGVRAIEDATLVKRLVADRIPLTVCPLSNRKLQVTPDLTRHPLPKLVEAGLLVSINSDDPAYFGGYVGRNYERTAQEMGLDDRTLTHIARSSFRSSFLDEVDRNTHISEVDRVAGMHDVAVT